jgi:hypothetical protein
MITCSIHGEDAKCATCATAWQFTQFKAGKCPFVVKVEKSEEPFILGYKPSDEQLEQGRMLLS